MKHLRDSDISIGGSSQKRKLKNIGHYHGYKGYRFAHKASNRLPITDFSQVAALYDFDTHLKALFYPRVMSIETGLKNYTLEAVLTDSDSAFLKISGERVLPTIGPIQVGTTERHGKSASVSAKRLMELYTGIGREMS